MTQVDRMDGVEGWNALKGKNEGSGKARNAWQTQEPVSELLLKFRVHKCCSVIGNTRHLTMLGGSKISSRIAS